MYTNDRPKRARISSAMLLYSFAIIASSPAVADGWSEGGRYQPVPADRSSLQYPNPETYRPARGKDRNPWALPEQAAPDYGHFPRKQSGHGRTHDDAQPGDRQAGKAHAAEKQSAEAQPADGEQQSRDNWSTRYDRFVTPETLQSIKNQQSRMQQTNDPGPYYRYDAYSSPGPTRRSPYTPYGGPMYPGPYGLGGYNPLFDSPMSSPWLTDPGAMFRGQSFSYVPDEAIGGIPPMRTPVFGPGRMPSGLSDGMMPDSMQDSAGKIVDDMPDKVFNPFTFLPDSNLNN